MVKILRKKIDVNGTIAATLFSGSGASLTGLTEGQIPTLTAAKIPDLDAAKIISGTIYNDRITLTPEKIPDLDTVKITSGTINNDRITCTAEKIPNISAAKITSGTINNARLSLNYGTKLGIGTEPAINTLHTYHETNNILRIGTGTWGTSSMELIVSREIGNLTNYRLISEIGDFKVQYPNNALVYGDIGTDFFKINHSTATIYKPLESKDNVGIGTTSHTTYKLDVLGDINATTLRGDGDNITNVNATNIATGTINQDRITLTTVKLYQN